MGCLMPTISAPAVLLLGLLFTFLFGLRHPRSSCVPGISDASAKRR
jgi:hypothetical protein